MFIPDSGSDSGSDLGSDLGSGSLFGGLCFLLNAAIKKNTKYQHFSIIFTKHNEIRKLYLYI